MQKSRTIMFIHGLFVTNLCWEEWVKYFEDKGYKCFAPGWPGQNGRTVAELRNRHPDKILSERTFEDLVEHFDFFARSLSEPPILIGHSMGGLIVQLLLQKGLGSCGVAIDSAPPRGLFSLSWPFVRSNFPTINPFTQNPYLMPFSAFQYAFVNGMPLEEQMAVYYKHVVPESLRIARGALTKIAKIDFEAKCAPLLFVAGSKDHIIPSSLNYKNCEKYRLHNRSNVINYRKFPGRTHYSVLAGHNWKEVADDINIWIRMIC
ncbi:MAG: alpha/beta fold hydrolase [bacterium]|nr:alpha/beta fold hydrolase [bacterium]